MHQRSVDFGYRLDRSFDRDFRKAVKVGLGVSVSSEVVAMVSRSSEAAFARRSLAGALGGASEVRDERVACRLWVSP